MRVLALDTTTRAGSVAIVDDEAGIRAERIGDAARPHAERLPGEILTILRDQQIALADVDLFAVAVGPGLFTGLRIGIATIQGLAFVHGRRVVGVSALDALAQIAGTVLPPQTVVAAWTDAHRHDVFTALYEVAASEPFAPDRLIELEAAAVGPPAETLARWAGQARRAPAAFAGDGSVMYADAIRARHAAAVIVAPACLAGAIGRIAIARAARGEAVEPAAVRPFYVRRPDAEVARDKAAPAAIPGLQR